MIAARAVRITKPGEADVLAIVDIEVREPGFGEVLVEVAACGLNRADVLQRRGFYPSPPGVLQDVPGLEYAGRVAAVGQGVSMRVGAHVMGIVGGGAMATHLVVHEREAMPVPAGLDLTAAAAIPEVFLTSWDALAIQGGLGAGDVLLVHAIGSGIGTAALQLARVLGARVVGTSRTPDKLERCAELGLEDGILVEGAAFASTLKERTGGPLADVILDCVGGAYLAENAQALAIGGRLVVIGLMGGTAGTLPLGALLAKRARIFGTTLRARPLEQKAALAQDFARRFGPMFADGTLVPVIGATRPMAEIADAHVAMEKNETFGKVVMTW